MAKRKVIIIGAAGRDFHNFNTRYREDESVEVVAFTAEQIPGIDDRIYPPELAGPLYPEGIPIFPEEQLADLIREHSVQECSMAYSDLPHEQVMHKAAIVNAAGADFRILGPASTMVESTKPVVAVCAVRTGCGKSQTTRRISEILRDKGLRVASIRHPMPYGDLSKQICQRFASYKDLETHDCTIEEREEYEPHIAMGNVIFAGVDYEKILREAEKEADVILWDGGNNDTSFYKPDLLIVDKEPRGAVRELDPALAHLRRNGSVSCVLGLRDVLDDPLAVRQEWRAFLCPRRDHGNHRCAFSRLINEVLGSVGRRSRCAAGCSDSGFSDEPEASSSERREVLGMTIAQIIARCAFKSHDETDGDRRRFHLVETLAGRLMLAGAVVFLYILYSPSLEPGMLAAGDDTIHSAYSLETLRQFKLHGWPLNWTYIFGLGEPIFIFRPAGFYLSSLCIYLLSFGNVSMLMAHKLAYMLPIVLYPIPIYYMLRKFKF